MKSNVIALLMLAGLGVSAEESALKRVCEREFARDVDLLVPSAGGGVLALTAPGDTEQPLALISVADGKVKTPLRVGERWAALADTDEEGKKLVLSAGDCEWMLIDPTGKEEPKKFKAKGKLGALQLSADGALLVTLSDKKTVELWDVASGESREIEVKEKEISQIAVSPEGLVAARSYQGQKARIYDSRNKKFLVGPTYRNPNPGELDMSDAPLRQLDFSRDGKKLFSVDIVGRVLLWDCEKTQDTLDVETIGTGTSILTAHLSPDATLMVTSQLDGTIAVRDVKSARVECLEQAYGKMEPGTLVCFLGPTTFATCCPHAPKVIVWEYSPRK